MLGDECTPSPRWLGSTKTSPFWGRLLALGWAVLLQGSAGEAGMERGPWRDLLAHGPALLPWAGGPPVPLNCESTASNFLPAKMMQEESC